jgi:glycosyltransferase involved in cell wall biosynthesis
LRGECPQKRWVAFCHDFSSLSRYWHGSAAGSPARLGGDQFGVTSVVLSEARRAELAALLHVPEEEITVIPPPLDLLQWLVVGEEARRITVATGWLERDLTLLVPSKLLPHKRLECVIEAVRALRRSGKDALAVVTAAPSPHEPSVSAALAGDLGARAREAGVGDRFHLGTEILGHPPGRETVRDLMILADLVFLPSAEEGYGTPVSEAVALRVPLLCADIPAFREAGGAYAEYLPDVTNGDAVAARVVALGESPEANRRREVLRSMARFREAILNLAAAT